MDDAFTEIFMPLNQQIFLALIIVGLLSLPLAMFYGWIVTKGWEQTTLVFVEGPADVPVGLTQPGGERRLEKHSPR